MSTPQSPPRSYKSLVFSLLAFLLAALALLLVLKDGACRPEPVPAAPPATPDELPVVPPTPVTPAAPPATPATPASESPAVAPEVVP